MSSSSKRKRKRDDSDSVPFSSQDDVSSIDSSFADITLSKKPKGRGPSKLPPATLAKWQKIQDVFRLPRDRTSAADATKTWIAQLRAGSTNDQYSYIRQLEADLTEIEQGFMDNRRMKQEQLQKAIAASQLDASGKKAIDNLHCQVSRVNSDGIDSVGPLMVIIAMEKERLVHILREDTKARMDLVNYIKSIVGRIEKKPKKQRTENESMNLEICEETLDWLDSNPLATKAEIVNKRREFDGVYLPTADSQADVKYK